MARPDLAQEVNFTASWGGGLLLLFGGAAYLVGGAAVGARRKGERVHSLRPTPITAGSAKSTARVSIIYVLICSGSE
jgi:hypothetical protein